LYELWCGAMGDLYISFLTRGVWDIIIYAVIVVGGIAALRRLRADLTRPTNDDIPPPPREEVGAPPRSSSGPES
jgi:hypothetical protein